MKRIITTAILLLAIITAGMSQKMCVVDIQKVLDNVSEYAEAQKEINTLAAKWKQEIAEKHDEIKGIYNKYQAEQVLMSDDMKTKTEDEIIAKEKEVAALNRQRFGEGGDLFKKREQLVKPIQDNVFSILENYADTHGYDIILDKSSAAGLLFVGEAYDKTDDVIKRIK